VQTEPYVSKFLFAKLHLPGDNEEGTFAAFGQAANFLLFV